jgi:myosin-15
MIIPCRDAVNYEVMGLMISSRDKMISKMFLDLRNVQESSKTNMSSPAARAQYGGHLVTMKPRAPTVGARFAESLNQLLSTLNACHPFYIRSIKPNADKCPMKFDMPVVLEQLRYTGMLETIRIRKAGFPAKMKYLHFVQRYRCLLHGRDPRGAPTKEVARVILDSMQPAIRARKESRRELYALGSHKVSLFLALLFRAFSAALTEVATPCLLKSRKFQLKL